MRIHTKSAGSIKTAEEVKGKNYLAELKAAEANKTTEYL
jgi:hypothetical protein